jgi:hypothetical protein
MIKAETLRHEGEAQNQTMWRYYVWALVKGRDTWALHRKWVGTTNIEQVHLCYEESEWWIVRETRAAHMDGE